MTAVFSTAAGELSLRMTRGDPISFRFVIDRSWSGPYQAQVRKHRTKNSAELGDLLATLTVVTNVLDQAEVDAYAALGHTDFAVGDTEFTLSATTLVSAAIPAGSWWWDMQEAAPGLTRLGGPFLVDPDVTVPA